MKIPYRQAVDAVLCLAPVRRFNSHELTLLLRFIETLGEDELDLNAGNDLTREDWNQILKGRHESYISVWFAGLERKGAIIVERKYTNKGYRAYRSLHPDFAEAILKHA